MKYFLPIALIIILFCLIYMVTHLKNEKYNRIILNVLALILLVWKTIQFTYNALNNIKIYPVELSHICYFLVSVLILIQYKGGYFSAGFFALICGIGYFVTGIFKPAATISNNDVIIVLSGIISHSILMAIGLITLFNYKKYHFKDIWLTYFLMTLIVVYIELINYDVIYKDVTNKDAYFIINFLNGNLLNKYLHIQNVTYGWLFTALVSLLIIIFTPILMKISISLYARKSKYKPDFLIDI